jgi:hypothetical protein
LAVVVFEVPCLLGRPCAPCSKFAFFLEPKLCFFNILASIIIFYLSPLRNNLNGFHYSISLYLFPAFLPLCLFVHSCIAKMITGTLKRHLENEAQAKVTIVLGMNPDYL